MKTSEIIDKKAYSAYVLPERQRTELLHTYPPKYENVIAHHITINYGISVDSPIPPMPANVQVIGYIDDNNGLEALVVSVDGKTKRPAYGVYHITWSLNPNRKAWESNRVLAHHEFEKVQPIQIQVQPEIIPL